MTSESPYKRARPVSPRRTRVALLAHGSRSATWASGLLPLVAALEAGHGPGSAGLCFLDLLTPSLPTFLEAAAADGCDQVLILPLFWSDAGHVLRDLPALLAQGRELAPGLAVTVLPAVGVQPEVLQAIVAVANTAIVAADVHALRARESQR